MFEQSPERIGNTRDVRYLEKEQRQEKYERRANVAIKARLGTQVLHIDGLH